MDSLDPRDAESVTTDAHSDIVAKPTDMRSQIAIYIFQSTSYTYGANGLTGFNYQHLKDNCKWNNVRAKEFIPMLVSCINYYIRGVNSKKK